MASNNKVAIAFAIALGTLSLAGCASEANNYAADSCDVYEEVVAAENGTDLDAINSANARFAATLAVWQSEGGEASELYDKLTGYAGALEGFLLTGTPETAQTYTEYKDAESGNIDSLCAEARG